MSLLSLSCLYPLWYTLCLSVSDKAAANSGKVSFYPVGFSLASYQQIMGDTQFFRSFLISAERTIFGTVFTIVVLAIFAYPLSKSANEYHPKNVIMWIVIFCMLFNGGTIPWYITMVNYGMIDSMIGLILCGGLPVFNLILLINFYRSLPKELMEAAEIDGAGVWTVLFRIVVPCAIPIFATLILFTSVGYWNEYFQGWYFQVASSIIRYRLILSRWSLISRRQIFRWIRSKNGQAVQSVFGCGKGIHRDDPNAGGISVPAEILYQRYYAGSCKRIRKRVTSSDGVKIHRSLFHGRG